MEKKWNSIALGRSTVTLMGMSVALTYLLNPLCVLKHIRPWPKCAIGFCRVLVVPGGSVSSCCPSSLSPLSFSMSLSVCLSFSGH